MGFGDFCQSPEIGSGVGRGGAHPPMSSQDEGHY